jgi:uncharacterized membrane protein
MPFYLLALLIGIIAGLRAMTAPAALSWAAGLGWIDVGGTWLSFLASVWTRWIFTVLALAELVRDQLPSTPARTEPVQFGTRILMGALCGAALAGLAGGLLGVAGAVIGTLGGRAVRARLAALFGSDPPAAFIEDAVAILGALLIVMAAR